MKDNDQTRERMAALEHEQWAHWTEYMLDVLAPLHPTEPDDLAAFKATQCMLIAMSPDLADLANGQIAALESIARWRKQCETPYAALSESEKASDREWADKAIDIARGRK